MPTITHNDLEVLYDFFGRHAEDDQDARILEWLSDLMDVTKARPNWPHEVTITPQPSISGYEP